jgi:hypothetical protein
MKNRDANNLFLVDGLPCKWHLDRLPRGKGNDRHARLYYGRNGKGIVRYDNETGKGDHRHVLNREYSYRFVSVKKLRLDFKSDVRCHGGNDDEKAD